MKRKGPDPVRNLHMLELIGMGFKILDHSDRALIGKKGKIIDETKNMFLVDINGRKKMISKKNGKFQIDVKINGIAQPVLLAGNDIIYRPVDRTKRCQKSDPIKNIVEKEGPKKSSHEDQ